MVLILNLKHEAHLELKYSLPRINYLPGYRFKIKSIHFFPPKTKMVVETKKLTMF